MMVTCSSRTCWYLALFATLCTAQETTTISSSEAGAIGGTSGDEEDTSATTILFSGFYTAPDDDQENVTQVESGEETTTVAPQGVEEEDAGLWVSYHQLEQDKYTANRHPCARRCTSETEPMVCRYHFKVEWYQTLSKACYDCPYNLTDCYRPDCIPGDGVQRPVIAVNKIIPGPSVEVCFGDEIVIDVENGMSEDTVTLHWHGHSQWMSAHMDGVPMVTQCPIQPRTTFRYNYLASTPGTHFWHSHTGTQRGDGVFGPLVVRVSPERDVHRGLYDEDLVEHTLVVLDWVHDTGVSSMTRHHHSSGTNKPPTLQINGKGLYRAFPANDSDTEIYTPPASFTVKQGLRYRFRLINAGVLNCPIQLSIDNHSMTAISTDGIDIVPVKVDSLVSYAGERWDFILTADRPIGNYWMRFRGLMDCDQRFTSAHQVAVLRYMGSDPAHNPPGEVSYEAAAELQNEGIILNPLNARLDETSLTPPELSAANRMGDPSLKPIPDNRIVLPFDFNPIDNAHFHKHNLYGYNQVERASERVMTPQLNGVSLKMPSSPLLSQHGDLDPATMCNLTTRDQRQRMLQQCNGTYCECTAFIELQLNQVVELVLIDLGVQYDANHPFHMHGSSFRVVAMDRLGNSTTVEEVEELDRAGRIHRNLVDPPVKDTVTVPDGGYTIIRFWAANPGYWLFHCHLEFHAEIGMAVVFKVGSHDRFPAEPPGFPKCGDYLHDYRPWTVNYQQTSKTGRDSAGKGTGWPNTIVRWWSSSSSPCFQPPSFGWLLTVAVVIGLFACRQRQFCSL